MPIFRKPSYFFRNPKNYHEQRNIQKQRAATENINVFKSNLLPVNREVPLDPHWEEKFWDHKSRIANAKPKVQTRENIETAMVVESIKVKEYLRVKEKQQTRREIELKNRIQSERLRQIAERVPQMDQGKLKRPDKAEQQRRERENRIKIRKQNEMLANRLSRIKPVLVTRNTKTSTKTQTEMNLMNPGVSKQESRKDVADVATTTYVPTVQSLPNIKVQGVLNKSSSCLPLRNSQLDPNANLPVSNNELIDRTSTETIGGFQDLLHKPPGLFESSSSNSHSPTDMPYFPEPNDSSIDTSAEEAEVDDAGETSAKDTDRSDVTLQQSLKENFGVEFDSPEMRAFLRFIDEQEKNPPPKKPRKIDPDFGWSEEDSDSENEFFVMYAGRCVVNKKYMKPGERIMARINPDLKPGEDGYDSTAEAVYTESESEPESVHTDFDCDDYEADDENPQES